MNTLYNFSSFLRKALSVMRSRVPRNHFNFSSDSHARSAAPVQLNWTCLYTNLVYKITNLLIFPEETLDNYKLKNNHLYSLFNTTVINSLVLYF